VHAQYNFQRPFLLLVQSVPTLGNMRNLSSFDAVELLSRVHLEPYGSLDDCNKRQTRDAREDREQL
jgi:hypothetical protein